MPRQTKNTRQVQERLCRAAAAGASMRDVAAFGKVAVQTLYNWLRDDEAFADRFEEARAAARIRVLEELQAGRRDTDSRALDGWISRTSREYAHVDRRPPEEAGLDYDALGEVFRKAGLGR